MSTKGEGRSIDGWRGLKRHLLESAEVEERANSKSQKRKLIYNFKILYFVIIIFNSGNVVINNFEFLNESCTAAIEMMNNFECEVIELKEGKSDMKTFLKELGVDFKVVICDHATSNVRNFIVIY